MEVEEGNLRGKRRKIKVGKARLGGRVSNIASFQGFQVNQDSTSSSESMRFK
jgi:hypothetical protein